MSILVLNLILAHFIGDFVLQPPRWVEQKHLKKVASKYLYLHLGIHAVALLLLLRFEHLGAIALIVGSHFLIDVVKLYLTDRRNYRWMFTLDQLLHLAVLLAVAYGIEPFSVDLEPFLGGAPILLITFLVFITYVCSIVIRMFLAPYIEEIAEAE